MNLSTLLLFSTIQQYSGPARYSTVLVQWSMCWTALVYIVSPCQALILIYARWDSFTSEIRTKLNFTDLSL